jgi:hypothetical protein
VPKRAFLKGDGRGERVIASSISGNSYHAPTHGHLGKVYIETRTVSAYAPRPEGNGIKTAVLQSISDFVGDKGIAGLSA